MTRHTRHHVPNHLLILLWLGCLAAPTLAEPIVAQADHDILVYGGTPGGIAAAIAAKRQGASVLLLETTKHLGGMTTGGLSCTDVGPRPEVIGGIAHEFFARADACYHDPKRTAGDFWYQEPHVAEQTFTAMLREAGVDVIFGGRVESVEKADARIVALTTTDHRTFRAQVFIDASYEGDLMARAKVSYAVGREGREVYGEPLAGFHPAPLRPQSRQYMAMPGSRYVHGTPAPISALGKDGKLLPGINVDWSAPGAGDHKPQAYNFRVIATANPANRVPFPKPAHYDPLRYEILARIIDAYPGIRFEKLVYLGPLPNGKFDVNASGLVQSTDYAGGNVDYPEADYATRDRIWQDHAEYVQGCLWFLANDPRVPAELRAQASQYGLARDEFTDNANWPYALYIREARRMVGACVMCQNDCTANITKPDSIGMGAFILDSHLVQRLADKAGNVIDEGNFDIPTRPYQIPYRCVTPKRQECENLLVPVCLSASHVSYGSIRMEPQFMILGHSTGVAAAMASRKKIAVQDVDVAALQATLRAQKQVLALELPGGAPTSAALGGIVVDDDAAIYTGEWIASAFGNPIDGFSHHDGNEGKGQKLARFEIRIPEAGMYEVRLAYTPAANRADNVPVAITHAGGTAAVTVNQKEKPKIDGLFTSLGVYSFEANRRAVVTVSNAGTNGFVSVDAVQLIRRTPKPANE